MDRLINGLVALTGRFFGWLLGTRNGWIFLGIVTFIVMMKFQPELLTQFVSNLCAWLINLLARIIEANRKSLELLLCIGIMVFFAIILPIKVLTKKGGTKK
jgi:hypothetical protein